MPEEEIAVVAELTWTDLSVISLGLGLLAGQGLIRSAELIRIAETLGMPTPPTDG